MAEPKMKAGAGHGPDAGADHSLKEGPRYGHGVSEEEGAGEWPAASFRAFLEAAPEAVVIVGREGRIAMVNSLTEKMFGYRREELLGNPVEMLVPERFRHRHEADRQGYERNPRTRPMGPARN